MDTRVLVTYATKHGATGEIAEKIGEVLREAGLPTDVAPTYQVGDVTPYARGGAGQRGLHRSMAQAGGQVPAGQRG